jgi:kynurenine 3-monooxygenase
MNSKKKIAVAGAGLVGSLVAIYLAKRGYSVTIFERRGDMRKGQSEGGRSINLALSNRGLRALEEVGLAEILRKVAIPMHGRTMHDLQGNLSYQPYGKQGQYINSISRSGLNMVLMDAAEQAGATIKFGAWVSQVDIQQGVIVQQTSNGPQSESFDLVIGGDGAFSAVRTELMKTPRFNYSQDYIAHGYKELHIPAGQAGEFQLEKNSLHIWPRESYMLIALPNPDGSFTCTLFFPFDGALSFSSMRSKEEAARFFQEVFPDAFQKMPTFLHDWEVNPTSTLVTVRCSPWHRGKSLVIGDAAHAIVPFFGQGMNAGFEDCRILNQLLDRFHDDWDQVFPEFEQLRKPDADAIAQLALDNFIEMRDLVADAEFLLRKKIEAKLHELYPEKWIPLYTMVTFREDIRYSVAYETGQKQKAIMDDVMKQPDLPAKWQNLNFERIVDRLA